MPLLRPDFEGAENAFATSFKRVDDAFRQRARSRAGQAMATGDYRQAASVLAADGQLDAADALQQRARTIQQDERTEAAEARKLQREEEARSLAAQKNALSTLRSVYDRAARGLEGDEAKQTGRLAVLGAIQTAAPLWKREGADDDDIEGLTATFSDEAADPAAVLEALGAEAEKWDIQKLDEDILAINPRTLEQRTVVDRQPRPIATPYGILYPPGQAPGQTPQPAAGTATRDTQGRPVPAPPAAPALTPQAADALISQSGGRVTSGLRTPARNAAVGGVPNSRHLVNRARDVVPAGGLSMGEMEARLRASGRFKKVLNEGDHLHTEFLNSASDELPGAAADDQLQDVGGGWMLQPMAKPSDERAEKRLDLSERSAARAEENAARVAANDSERLRLAREEATLNGVPSGYRRRRDGNLEFIPGGPADPATKAATLKVVPAKVSTGLYENKIALGKIDRALQELRRYPKAVGLRNALGDNINQRVDPRGIDARAAIADIGSQKIHDRSGAAVTAAESPRLKPFIPLVTDTPQAAAKKLRLLRYEYETMVNEVENSYNEDTGYRAPPKPDRLAAFTPAQRKTGARLAPSAQGKPQGSRENPIAIANMAEFNKLKIGQHYIARDGNVYPKRAAAASAPKPPRQGEVRKGYRFKGGDPASPNSWVKVR